MKSMLFSFITFILLSHPAWSGSVYIVSDEWPQMEILAEFLETNGYEVVKGEQDELPSDLSEHDAVIQFIHGMLNDEPAAKLMNYANQGGRLIVLHHGISSKKKQTKGWYEFLGVKLDRTDDAEYYYEWIHDTDFTLVNVNPNHYITSHKVGYPTTMKYRAGSGPTPAVTFPAWPLKNTEVFINHQFIDGAEKTVLFAFHFKHPESGKIYTQDRGGWYKQTGAGYTFYFMPGHTDADFKTAQYPQIILNSVNWKPCSN